MTQPDEVSAQADPRWEPPVETTKAEKRNCVLQSFVTPSKKRRVDDAAWRARKSVSSFIDDVLEDVLRADEEATTAVA
jgi:hypothetical protein